ETLLLIKIANGVAVVFDAEVVDGRSLVHQEDFADGFVLDVAVADDFDGGDLRAFLNDEAHNHAAKLAGDIVFDGDDVGPDGEEPVERGNRLDVNVDKIAGINLPFLGTNLVENQLSVRAGVAVDFHLQDRQAIENAGRGGSGLGGGRCGAT